MKTFYLFLLLFLSVFLNAQITFTKIPMPAGYGINSNGTLKDTPIYRDGNYIYGITHKLINNSPQSFLFKYNLTNNTTDIITGASFSDTSDLGFTKFQTLNGYTYFCNGSLYRINPINNTAEIVLNSVSYQIIGTKIYTIQTGDTYIYDTETNIKTEYSIPINVNGNTQQSKLSLFGYVDIGNTAMYAYGRFSNFNNSTGSYFQDYRIFKIDASGIHSIYNLPSNYTGSSTDTVYPKFLLVNNKILSQRDSGEVDAFDINTNVFTQNIYTGKLNQGFVYNNSAYFYNDSYVMYQSDGTSVQLAGFPRFYGSSLSNGDYGFKNNYILDLNNKLIGSNNGFWTSDCTSANTVQLSTTYNDIRGVTNLNGKIYFYRATSLPGPHIIEFNPQNSLFNEISGTDSFIQYNNSSFGYQNALYTGGGYNNLLGFYKIDLSFLATSEASKNKIEFYPNPVKDILNFSEELKSAEIYSLDAKQVMKNITGKSVNISKLPKGVYLLNGIDRNGSKTSQKIIKE